ncbi:MAG TPA: gamma carbonic anhydrase family protein [Steroidobacteraceae bacterium]|nr:gamma carbonic anhydrase family protein [Steroidobacteraceae bacterium]
MPAIRPYLDHVPRLGARVYVDPSAVVIGDVELGDDVSVWPTAVVRGDVHSIRIGARTSVQDGSVLHVTHDGPYTPGGRALLIGADVTIGHKAILHACTVEDTSLIGMGSIVLDGSVIERHVMLGAGALVPPGKRLVRGGLYVGAPARRVRDLTPQEIASLTYSAEHYARIKDRYLGKAQV